MQHADRLTFLSRLFNHKTIRLTILLYTIQISLQAALEISTVQVTGYSPSCRFYQSFTLRGG